MAVELAQDLAALRAWARPAIAEQAGELQRALLRGADVAVPQDRAAYLRIWRLGLRPPTEAGLDPSTWDDVLREVLDDTAASARSTGREAAAALGWGAAVVALVGLGALAIRGARG